MSVRRAPLPCLLSAAAVLGLVGCPGREPTPTSEPPSQAISVVQGPAVGSEVATRKGTGWYPNLEVDAENRLHLAWVDADKGDVLYAVTAEGGSTVTDAPQVIESEGAAGSFLRLALAPGGVPVFSYARQDESVLRIAWRVADRTRMKEAGADVDLAPLPELPAASKTGSPIRGAVGVVVEEVGFGDQVGRGSSLAFDKAGRLAFAYYAADDRLRLARRPADVPAFGGTGLGVLEKRDLDPSVSSSLRVLTDVLAADDGSIVVSYAHDVITDARLRIARLAKDADRPQTLGPDKDAPSITVDGLKSSLHPRSDGAVDVVSLDTSERAVFVRTLELSPLAWRGPREKLFDVDGTALVEKKSDGWVGVARDRGDRKGEGGGVFVYLVDEVSNEGRVSRSVRRVRLDGGGSQDDSWLDVVVRPDGRAAAVWFDQSSASLKLYAP